MKTKNEQSGLTCGVRAGMDSPSSMTDIVDVWLGESQKVYLIVFGLFCFFLEKSKVSQITFGPSTWPPSPS